MRLSTFVLHCQAERYLDIKKISLSSITAVTKDSSVTVRLPAALKDRIGEIALETDRSLSNTVLWLLKRGIDAYAVDGVLVAGAMLTDPVVQQAPGLHFDRKLQHLTGKKEVSKHSKR
jgi:hypothetical protein